MYKYNIVLKDMADFVLASCQTEEAAESYKKEIEKNDKWLAAYYNWQKLPQYEIVKTKGEKGKNEE